MGHYGAAQIWNASLFQLQYIFFSFSFIFLGITPRPRIPQGKYGPELVGAPSALLVFWIEATLKVVVIHNASAYADVLISDCMIVWT